MKRVVKLTLMAAFMMIAGTSSSFAQKFGYLNSQELILMMPERDSVEIKLNALAKELGEQLELIQVEYNNKYAEYQKSASTLSEAVKNLKEQELASLGERFNQMQQSAQQEMALEQDKLTAPIVEKAQKAIEKVSKANGLTAVFDTSMGALAYFNESAMTDLLPLVKKELGIVGDGPTK